VALMEERISIGNKNKQTHNEGGIERYRERPKVNGGKVDALACDEALCIVDRPAQQGKAARPV